MVSSASLYTQSEVLYAHIAGINAARRAQETAPIVIPRDSSYLGTLVDDLVTKVSRLTAFTLFKQHCLPSC